MAISYSYPMGTPKLTDTVLGVQYEEMKDPAVKNFSIDGIVALTIDEIVFPVPTLQGVTNEGANTTVQMQINGVDVATLDDIPEPKYKVYTALVTQSGGDYPTLSMDGPLVIGVTYEILDDDSGTVDFTNVGAPNNNIGTFFTATGTTPTSWGVNLLGQLLFNSGAPTAIVLENTIGNVFWVYQSPGRYLLSSNSLFTNNKTFINGANFSNPVFNRMITEGGEGFAIQRGYFFYKDGEALIQLKTLGDMETLEDSIIVNPICIEIRVYN